MKCCSSVCKVGNAARIVHFLLTFFVLYVLLKNQHSELYKAWQSKDVSFIVAMSLLAVSLLLYLVASLTDPGILPKADPLLLTSAAFKINGKSPTDSTIDSSTVELSLDTITDSDGLVNPQDPEGKGRFCRVCHLTQPMRSKHCYQCGRCVRRFDHHCPWLGNCVGEGNHKFFWMFLTAETALLAWAIWIAWSAIAISGDTLDWLRANILVFLCLFIVFIGSILVSLLFLYHTYLMLSGQTTWEQASRHRIHYLKDLQDLTNPFDEGCCCNVARFVCSGLRDWEQVYVSRTRTKSSA